MASNKEAPDDYDERYTDPALRRKLKEEIKASDKGGKPGTWSARKSQLLVREYEKHGGGYKGEKGEEAESLTSWTNEKWTTQDGSANARQADGTTKRYLPERAWELLSEDEKREAERRKAEGDRRGEQFAPNTSAAKEARRKAQAGSTKKALYQEAQKRGIPGRSKMSKGELERALQTS